MSGIPGNRTISGTWGEVWVDGEKWAELTGCQAKYAYTKSDVQMCGQMEVDTKVTAVKGTGSITVNHVFTRNITRADQLVNGIDVRATIVVKLADPNAYGYERAVLYNVSFDDETIMDFQSGNYGKKTYPFTFTRREWLDKIVA